MRIIGYQTIQYRTNRALFELNLPFSFLRTISTVINRNNLWFIPYFPFCSIVPLSLSVVPLLTQRLAFLFWPVRYLFGRFRCIMNAVSHCHCHVFKFVFLFSRYVHPESDTRSHHTITFDIIHHWTSERNRNSNDTECDRMKQRMHIPLHYQNIMHQCK